MTSLNFTPRVPVFDGNVRVGHTDSEPSPCGSRSELLAEMDAFGVARAAIYHAQADAFSAMAANLCLEDWLGDDDRLVPQWSVLPTAESMAQLRALHEQGRAQCVRLFNAREAGLPFRPWAYSRLLSWLDDERISLWIPLPDADPDELVTTLQAFPTLVTVLVGAHYQHALWVRPLLEALPNAHLELSRYEVPGEIEALRGEFGTERLVYGSWYSRYAMGPMLFYLHHTSLSEAELALVCAGNLERILRTGGRS